MTEGQAIFKEDQANNWKKCQFEMSQHEIEKEQKEAPNMRFANLVIKSGAKHYGLPADAKERRM